VSLVAGLGAKEIVASTIGVLYSDGSDSSDQSDSSDGAESSDDSENYSHLQQLMTADGITPLAGYCYLLFVLLYFPCLATIAAIKNETGSWRWAVFAAVYTTVVAWVVSAAVFQIGSLL
jgi:ferrous iron transport protein B